MRRREQADPFIRYQYGKSTFNTEEWDTFLQIAQRPGKVFDRLNGRSENERDFTRLEVTELFDNVYHVYISN